VYCGTPSSAYGWRGELQGGPEFQLPLLYKVYLSLAVTRKAPQFLAPILESEAEQAVKSCNANPEQKEACLIHSLVVENPQKDVGFELRRLSLEFPTG